MATKLSDAHKDVEALLRDDAEERTVFVTAVQMLEARGLKVSSGISGMNMWYLYGIPRVATTDPQDSIFTACANTLLLRSTCASKDTIRTKYETFIEGFLAYHTPPASFTLEEPRVIIVTDESRTVEATERLYFRDRNDFKFAEIFTERSLRFNVLRHRLVPTHRALSRKEISVIAERYRGNRTADANTSKEEKMQMRAFARAIPAMGYLDPVARFLGAVPARCGLVDIKYRVLESGSEVGTIFEINRKGGEIAYRVVVADPLKE